MNLSVPTIVLSIDPHIPTASVVVAISAGSQDERPGNFGLAHLLEHMIFRGTKKHPSQLAFVSELIKLGAKFNGETARDQTLYYATTLPNLILQALALLIEMIKQPLFDPQKLEIEKQAVLNELKTAASSSTRFLQDEVFLPNLFQHELARSHPPMGSSRDVIHSTYQDLIELYHSAYTDPLRIVISLHGNILDSTCSTAEKLQSKILDIWNATPYTMSPIQLSESQEREDKLKACFRAYDQVHRPVFPLVRHPHLTECYAAMGWHSVPLESFDSYVLSWISTYLTGDLVASLYYQLRVQRGLVYQIHSGQYSLKDDGIFFIKWQTRKMKNIPLTVKLIHQVLDELKTFDNKKTLQLWKHYMITRYQMARDSSLSIAKLYAQQMLIVNKIRPFSEIVALIESLTCEQIRRVAKLVFNKKVTIAVLAP